MDSGVRELLVEENWDELVDWVKIGGKIVFDDLVPIELWPPEWDDLVDRKREFVLRNRRLVGTEVRVTATQVALIATRVR